MSLLPGFSLYHVCAMHVTPTSAANSEERQSLPQKTRTPKMELLLLVSKDILSQRVQMLEYSSDEGTTYEGLGQLLREEVPQVPAILIKVLPKYGRARECVLVSACVPKVIQHKVPFGQVSKGVVGLWLGSQHLLTFTPLLLRTNVYFLIKPLSTTGWLTPLLLFLLST